ncbi:hypothetical protein [Dokdonella soli]|uniref:Uncharacterized protein n=1 Tax=Dokdonella soli TaxID=529810 RepID=A0ABN1II12_9GAMM
MDDDAIRFLIDEGRGAHMKVNSPLQQANDRADDVAAKELNLSAADAEAVSGAIEQSRMTRDQVLRRSLACPPIIDNLRCITVANNLRCPAVSKSLRCPAIGSALRCPAITDALKCQAITDALKCSAIALALKCKAIRESLKNTKVADQLRLGNLAIA